MDDNRMELARSIVNDTPPGELHRQLVEATKMVPDDHIAPFVALALLEKLERLQAALDGAYL